MGSELSALLTRFLGSLLYDVKPLDPITFVSVAVGSLAGGLGDRQHHSGQAAPPALIP